MHQIGDWSHRFRGEAIDAARKTKYLQEGMIAFGLTQFFFESCYVFAQRVDNALVSLFSLARALQLRGCTRSSSHTHQGRVLP